MEMFSILSDIYLGVTLLRHIVILYLTFETKRFPIFYALNILTVIANNYECTIYYSSGSCMY